MVFVLCWCYGDVGDVVVVVVLLLCEFKIIFLEVPARKGEAACFPVFGIANPW